MSLNELKGDFERLAIQESFEIEGYSDRQGFTSSVQGNITVPAGSGVFLRVLTTADAYLRLGQPSAATVADPNSDNVSVFCPFGETLFIRIPDTGQAAVVSALGVTGAGDLYASIVR